MVSALVFLVLLGAISVAGVVGSVVVTARDGYRRQPKEQFARSI